MLAVLLAFGLTAWAQDSNPELLFSNNVSAFYQFSYPSVSVTGEPITLSSLMAFWKPQTMGTNTIKTVMINNHYTITANAQCPSNITVTYDSNYPDYLLLSPLVNGNTYNIDYPDLSTRCLVIMPDYEGYGLTSDRTHPYLAEELTAQQVVDGVIYGLQLYQQLSSQGSALPLDDEWRSFSVGYSQGGAVALAVQRHIEQYNLSDELHFSGTLCGDGPYDLIATLRYYMYDNGNSHDVTTIHEARKATLPVVLPMILKGMIDSDPALAGYQITDYLVQGFLDTGILDWLNSKTVTNSEISNAWLQQLEQGATTVNGITYPAPENMSAMFSKHTVPGTIGQSEVVWANLDGVFTEGFYNYLNNPNNLNSVPSTVSNAYEAMHRALVNNSICTGWEPMHRIQFMHSKGDMVVPYDNYLAFRDAHPSGENVIYRVDDTFSETDHQATGTTFLSNLYKRGTYLHWIDESPDFVTLLVEGYGDSNDGWMFIASPLTDDIAPTEVTNLVNVTDGLFDLYRFDQNEENEWRNYKANTTGFVLENGRGYLYARKATGTLGFTGTFNTASTQDVDLEYESNSPDPNMRGWNIIGNPFPVAATLNTPFYVINGRNVVPNTSGTNVIEACTGVMVRASGPNESVTFTRTNAAIPAPQPDKGNLQIVLSQQADTRNTPTELIDKAIVSFNEGERLEKFVFNARLAKVFLPQDNKNYAIAFSDRQGELPVNFKATENSEYTLTIQPENVEMAYLHLFDKLTGADIDLLSTPTYTFEGRTNDSPSRFRLVFIAEENPSEAANEPFAFVSDGQIIIDGEGYLQVFDALGRQLLGKELSTSHSPLPTSHASGVYVLRLINGKDVKTQKIIIE